MNWLNRTARTAGTPFFSSKNLIEKLEWCTENNQSMKKSVLLRGTISASGRNAGDGPTCGDGDGSGWNQNRSFLGSKKKRSILEVVGYPSYTITSPWDSRCSYLFIANPIIAWYWHHVSHLASIIISPARQFLPMEMCFPARWSWGFSIST